MECDRYPFCLGLDIDSFQNAYVFRRTETAVCWKGRYEPYPGILVVATSEALSQAACLICIFAMQIGTIYLLFAIDVYIGIIIPTISHQKHRV